MTNPDSSNKPTLEELLRLKRAERPQPEYWEQFDRELRRKQLAATIEPRPWWLGLSIWSRKLAPVGLPAGAAAALALAAVSYQTIGWAPDAGDVPAPVFAANDTTSTPMVADANESVTRVEIVSETADVPSPLDSLSDAPVMVAAATPAVAPASSDEPGAVEAVRDMVSEVVPVRESNVALASLLPGLGLHRGDVVRPSNEQSPSERFIAYNLAAAQKESPELVRLSAVDISVGSPASAATLASAPVVDPAAAPVQEMSPRNARLLALVKPVEDSETAQVSANIAREQAGRLNDDILYASASRLGVGGDRFSISF